MDTNTPTIGISTQVFNASLAEIYQVATDLIFTGAFADFLSDPHYLDITPDTDKTGCTVNWRETGGRPCSRTYYLPGGIEPSVPALLNSSYLSSSNILLAEKQLGSIHQHTDGDPNWIFNETSECSAYGFEQFGIGMCFRNGETNEILARRWAPSGYLADSVLKPRAS
jgi:hypothetical protein